MREGRRAISRSCRQIAAAGLRDAVWLEGGTIGWFEEEQSWSLSPLAARSEHLTIQRWPAMLKSWLQLSTVVSAARAEPGRQRQRRHRKAEAGAYREGPGDAELKAKQRDYRNWAQS